MTSASPDCTHLLHFCDVKLSVAVPTDSHAAQIFLHDHCTPLTARWRMKKKGQQMLGHYPKDSNCSLLLQFCIFTIGGLYALGGCLVALSLTDWLETVLIGTGFAVLFCGCVLECHDLLHEIRHRQSVSEAVKL